MASIITIRNLDPEVQERMRQRARRHERSMEAEIRAILTATPLEDEEPHDFQWALRNYAADIARLGSTETLETAREQDEARWVDFSEGATS
ncbi:MAG: Arc family DNA-binding protein [Propionibacteriaceae bacterium]|jgi:plasmid stability protein|nr:Arc family DNA-binding protein [Propionibacteriaceae bacterium]